MKINNEIVKYLPLKESRDGFYIEYRPPIPKCRFATLNLIFLNQYSEPEIIQIMEDESKNIINRFPIPVMVSAFNDLGDLLLLHEKTQSYLIAFRSITSKIIEFHWEEISDARIPDIALDSDYCNKIFKHFGYITRSEIDNKFRKEIRSNKFGMFILLLWAVIIPSIVLIIEFNFPTWLSLIVLVFSLSKAFLQALKILGKIKPSLKEQQEQKEKALIEHHHYYCQMNPEGFSRLKLEVLEKKERESIKNEYQEIKSNNANNNSGF